MAGSNEKEGKKVVEDNIKTGWLDGRRVKFDPVNYGVVVVDTRNLKVKKPLPTVLEAGITHYVLVPYKDKEKISQAEIEKQLDKLLEEALLEGERDLS